MDQVGQSERLVQNEKEKTSYMEKQWEESEGLSQRQSCGITGIQEDRSLFARLMMVAKSRPEIDIKEAIGQHEFSVVPRLHTLINTMLLFPFLFALRISLLLFFYFFFSSRGARGCAVVIANVHFSDYPFLVKQENPYGLRSKVRL